MPLEILTAPKIAESDYPQGVNRVLHVDRLTAAQEERPTWTPTPPPAKPAAAQQIREAAAVASQESLDARNRALNLEAEAIAVEHSIFTAGNEVRRLELRLAALEKLDFVQQGQDAESALKASLETLDTYHGTDHIVSIALRAPLLAKLHPIAVKEAKAALNAARAQLKAITEEKI